MIVHREKTRKSPSCGSLPGDWSRTAGGSFCCELRLFRSRLCHQAPIAIPIRIDEGCLGKPPCCTPSTHLGKAHPFQRPSHIKHCIHLARPTFIRGRSKKRTFHTGVPAAKKLQIVDATDCEAQGHSLDHPHQVFGPKPQGPVRQNLAQGRPNDGAPDVQRDKPRRFQRPVQLPERLDLQAWLRNARESAGACDAEVRKTNQKALKPPCRSGPFD